MKTEKSWTDQPDVVRNAEVVLSLYLKDVGAVEVREYAGVGRGSFLVTAGNLFGSQTVCCDGYRAVFNLLHLLNAAKGKALKLLPEGVVVVENAEPPDEARA